MQFTVLNDVLLVLDTDENENNFDTSGADTSVIISKKMITKLFNVPTLSDLYLTCHLCFYFGEKSIRIISHHSSFSTSVGDILIKSGAQYLMMLQIIYATEKFIDIYVQRVFSCKIFDGHMYDKQNNIIGDPSDYTTLDPFDKYKLLLFYQFSGLIKQINHSDIFDNKADIAKYVKK